MAKVRRRRGATLPLAIGVAAGIVLTQFTPVGSWVWNLIYGLGAPMAAANVATAALIIGVCVALALAVSLATRRGVPGARSREIE